MAQKLRANATVPAQIKMLGHLAAKLDSDQRHPIDVFNDFFRFTLEEREAFLRAYNDRDDPIDAIVR